MHFLQCPTKSEHALLQRMLFAKQYILEIVPEQQVWGLYLLQMHSMRLPRSPVDGPRLLLQQVSCAHLCQFPLHSGERATGQGTWECVCVQCQHTTCSPASSFCASR